MQNLLDCLLNKYGYTRYKTYLKSGISQSTLQNINKKELKQWTGKNIEMIAQHLGKYPPDLYKELYELEMERKRLTKCDEVNVENL